MKVKTYIYPAFFRRIPEGGFSIDFPDLQGCISAGDTVEEAMTMAREALSLHLYGLIEDMSAIPTPSDLLEIIPEVGAFLTLVEGRPDMVRDSIKNKAVKKTLTIPYWMNEEAERLHINFSQVLQEAVRERLGV
jgi:predicted RNase H-like HicB family nuclease